MHGHWNIKFAVRKVWNYDHSPDILLIKSSGNCMMIIMCLHAGRKFKALIGNRNEGHYQTGYKFL